MVTGKLDLPMVLLQHVLVNDWGGVGKCPEYRVQHTVAGPGQLLTEIGLLVVDLEPHSAVSLPVLDIYTIRCPGHVECHGSGVVDVGSSRVGDGGASSNLEGVGGTSVAPLEAPDLVRVEALNEAIVLPVVGPADVAPVGRVVDLGEGIVGADLGRRRSEDESNLGKHGGGCLATRRRECKLVDT